MSVRAKKNEDPHQEVTYYLHKTVLVHGRTINFKFETIHLLDYTECSVMLQRNEKNVGMINK
jgi:hypothetical protein